MMELWNRRSRALFAAVGLGFGGYAFAVILVLLAAGALLALGVPVLDRPSLTVAVSIVMGQGVAFGLFALRICDTPVEGSTTSRFAFRISTISVGPSVASSSSTAASSRCRSSSQRSASSRRRTKSPRSGNKTRGSFFS
ncbi:hypothetical protein ACFFQF_26160 [Haladaptatus pallidirubidus]|uniref:hypothetical protein n=1 Tax=Haladaptatus pallidirubidus TaxID=1008152 RepID=UPI0035EAE5D4